MRVTFPSALLLLVLLPLIAWMGWPAAGPARRREFLSLTLRLIIAVCLILALSGLEILGSGRNLAVVFLVDVSDSMSQEAIALEVDYVRRALEAMGPEDQAAVVVFGADALVERSMSPVQELSAIASTPITNQTDLAEAVQLGLALFPSGYAKRMVILSDGAQTSGDVFEAARFAGASDVQIVALPFVNPAEAEALITNVDLPSHLRPGEEFDLRVSIKASGPTSATLQVLSEDQVLYEGRHALRRGEQTLSLPLTAGEPGFAQYRVLMVPQEDRFYQNNYLDAFSRVEGPPRVLIVAPEAGEVLPGGEVRPDESSGLLRTLQAAAFQVDLVRPTRLPSDLSVLAQYDSVVLVDVPARAMSNRQMQNLQSYVRDLGGGLVVIGGPTSYGVGGYFQTPLEAALPVDMQITDEQRRPSLAIVFIIDHSGSMADASGGVQKLELAKEAAARSIELLFPTDRVGVIAFDDTASWVVPMTDLSFPEEVMSGIGSIRPGGGTDIMAGLRAVADVLPGDPARVKHVILLTDGGADPTGIPELVERLNTESGITLSTVGIGNDAAPYLEDLAMRGAGRYHFTNDPSSIPSIFTEETSLATRAYIVEESFFPTLVNSSPILSSIAEVPPLHGYIASSPKDLAQVILQSDQEDPILASWQYGLGRSVAFTSDATGRWARDWLRWDAFPVFWFRVVRYTMGTAADTALQVGVQTAGATARLMVDARTPAGEFLNGYDLQVSIVEPDGETQSARLHQIAPGSYEAFFRPTEQGVYLLHFSGTSEADQYAPVIAQTTGWTLAYSPEYKQIQSDPAFLLRLVTDSGGQIASSDPADVFVHDLQATRASRSLGGILLLIAVLLLPFDVASRRLMLTRQDLARLLTWTRERLRAPKVATPQPVAPVPHMEALRRAKSRVAGQMAVTPPRETTVEPVADIPQGSEPLGDEGDLGDLSVGSSQTRPSTASTLLESKRRRGQKSK